MEEKRGCLFYILKWLGWLLVLNIVISLFHLAVFQRSSCFDSTPIPYVCGVEDFDQLSSWVDKKFLS